MFYDGAKTSELGSRSHILKHLHGRIHEDTLWSGYIAIIYFIHTKYIFLHFFRHGDQFYNRYINTADIKKYGDDGGSGVKPNHALQRSMKCIYFGDLLQEMFDRDRTMEKDNFGRKRKAAGCIYLPGSDFREAEVHL